LHTAAPDEIVSPGPLRGGPDAEEVEPVDVEVASPAIARLAHRDRMVRA
jgi:hypothetical protein